jgi:ubiquitin carboxyl-terminal hydrolase 34
LEFQKALYEPPTDGSGVATKAIFMEVMQQIPKWAPSLLGYYDPEVRYQTEDFLQLALFQFGSSPNFTAAEGGQERESRVQDTAQDLGMTCLAFLRDNYVSRRVQVAKDTVSSLQKVIAQCSAYYAVDEDDASSKDAEFSVLSQCE